MEGCTMHVLTLVGSFRKQGNTARIVRMIEARMRALSSPQGAPFEFETLFLGDLDIRACRGCRACFDRGEDACPLKDDVASIRAKFEAANAIVMASPVYVDDVSGLMKNLMDRLAYLCHRPALGGKYAYVLTSVGSGGTGHTLRTMYVALLTWGCHLLGQTGMKMGALASDRELVQHQAAAERVADTLYAAITRSRNLNPAFISLMAFRIQQLAWRREPQGSYDHTYWQARGWLADGCTYYMAHRANPVKVALARLAGAVMFHLMM
jgi:multimeric flavodoxin WrbA